MKMSKNVKLFADDSKELYTAFKDYADHWLAVNRNVKGKTFSAKSLDDKETVINKLFAEEVEKHVDRKDADLAHYVNHPSVVWFADSVKDAMIDMIIPDVLNTSVGLVADIRYLDLGDTARFDIANNGLFTVAKAGYRNRNTLAQRLEDTTYTMIPENHEVTVVTNLYNMMTGRDSVAKYAFKVALSIEAEMLNEVYAAFEAAVDAATVPPALKVTNFTEPSAVQLAQRVEAYNRAPAVFMGTELALAHILPANAQYRYFLSDDIWKLGYVPQFRNHDVVPVKQIADYKSNDYGLKLNDNKIYVLTPSTDKIVKVVIAGGSLSHTEEGFSNANLSAVGTVTRAWGVDVITNSIAGVITV
jgi:hypothetical protein